MFGHGYLTNNEILYNPKYRLFDFSCTLIPEIEVDYQLMKSIKLHEENKWCNNLLSGYNDENFHLNNEKMKDFTIIIPEVDPKEREYELINKLRKNCNIKKGFYLNC